MESSFIKIDLINTTYEMLDRKNLKQQVELKKLLTKFSRLLPSNDLYQLSEIIKKDLNYTCRIN